MPRNLPLALLVAPLVSLSGCTTSDHDRDRKSDPPDSGGMENAIPEVTAVSLSPKDATTDDTQAVSVTAADADGDDIALTYTWSVNDVELSAAGRTLSGEAFAKGDVVVVSVRPSDSTTSFAR